MAVLLLLVGGVLVITGALGTISGLGSQIYSDFSGSRSFLPWVLAIAIIGGIGYVPGLKRPANLFLVLLLVVFLLSNAGVWSQLQSLLSGSSSSSNSSSSSAIAGGLLGGIDDGSSLATLFGD